MNTQLYKNRFNTSALRVLLRPQQMGERSYLRYFVIVTNSLYPKQCKSLIVRLNEQLNLIPVPTLHNLSLRNISTSANKNNATILNPWYLTGFSDAESSFMISFYKDSTLKTVWRAKAIFSINLHIKDLALLKRVQLSLGGVGSITNNGENAMQLRVSSLPDLINVVIPHFESYPLRTQKLADFLLFKQAVEIMSRKEHLTIEGLHKILAIKASMNLGLSDSLKTAFCSGGNNIPSLPRPKIELLKEIDPNWLVGFVEGEGCFSVHVSKLAASKLGFTAQIRFIVTQHSRDAELMKSLIDYFGCGQYQVRLGKSAGDFIVSRFSDIRDKIIPFFDTYPLQGVKSLNFGDFRLAADIINVKGHLTKDGLDEISFLKGRMNYLRTH